MLTVSRDPGSPDVETCGRLADEHALLLQQVAARAEDLLDELSAGRWPRVQLTGFVDYLHHELIEQVGLEERLVFAGRGDFDRLDRDHVRLRFAVEAIARAAAPGSVRDAAALAAIVRGLVTQLAEHVVLEQRVLVEHCSATGWADAMAALGPVRRAWYPLTEGRVVHLDAIAPQHRDDAVDRRVGRLRPGEHVQLLADSDPSDLLAALRRRHDDLGVRYLTEGPPTWLVQVTRRGRR